MQRVNLYQFVALGFTVHPLSEIKAGDKVKDRFYVLYSAQMWLDYLLGENLVPLGVTKPAAQALLGAVNAVLGTDSPPKPDMEKDINAFEAYSITSSLTTFETVLQAHLQSLSMYFVSRQLAYETSLLIEEGDKLLPQSARDEAAEAISDLQQAGKCLAFDIPTAAGFHIIRATESVIRRYYAAIVGTLPKPKMRNWGAYIKNLKAASADKKVTGFLSHIKDTYRNPVLHPEETLSQEDAQVLLGACISAIVLMVNIIKQGEAAKEIAAAEAALAGALPEAS